MSITTSTGLISGLPVSDIIDQLIKIEARPQEALKTRVANTQNQRTAYMALSGLLSALKASTARFDEAKYFRTSTATSTNDKVMTAKADEDAPVGTYQFQVASLVSNHQVISGGFSDRDETPVGRGTLTIENVRGKVNPSTLLDSLNEEGGVQRGSIRIRDRSGATADVDLRAALTVDDVLTAINSRVDIGVRAGVRGDNIVLTDVSGGTGLFSVSDIGTTHTAADLGLVAAVQGSQIDGRALLRITEKSSLSILNDDAGIRRVNTGRVDGDFVVNMNDKRVAVNLSEILQFSTRLEQLNSGQGVRLGKVQITNRAGKTATIDLSDRGDGQVPRNMEEVIKLLQGAKDDTTGESLQLNVSMANSRIVVADGSIAGTAKAVSHLIIKDIDNGYSAQDLGIAADTENSSVNGSSIFRIRTVGDVLRAINYGSLVTVDGSGAYVSNKDADQRYLYNDNAVTAAIAEDGKRLLLTSNDGEPMQIDMRNNSRAAFDLGLVDRDGAVASERVIAGLNTVLLKSLNGGKGVGRGIIQIEAGDGTPGQPGTGTTTLVDLSSADTLQDVLDAINATSATSKVQAAVSDSGLGIVLKDISGGSGAITVADVGGGTAAADLKIAGSRSGSVGAGNLQRQYVTEATSLSDLNGNTGVSFGKIRFTNSNGNSQILEFKSDSMQTVGDVLEKINGYSELMKIKARINDTGDGILIEDVAGGGGPLKIEEYGATKMAASLNILGQAKEGSTTIDGSYEIHVDVTSDDALLDVMAKVNAASTMLSATVVNDGSRLNPYRLSVLSRISGSPGEILLDGGTTGLSFNTMVKAKDAVVFFGGQDSPDSIRLVSSTNTVSGFVPGLTLDLTGADEKPVSVSVSRNVDKMVSDIGVFVSQFNTIVGQISTLTAYNADTNERGLLMGDFTISTVQSRLYNMVTSPVTGADSGYARLSSVGITIGDGARLIFDETKFRQAYAANPNSVEKLFTYETVVQESGKPVTKQYGIGYQIQKVLNDLTASSTGLITRQTQDLEDREEFFTSRINDMQKLLDNKRAFLTAQFQAMEAQLAKLQAQQSSLSGLSSIASTSLNLSSVS